MSHNQGKMSARDIIYVQSDDGVHGYGTVRNSSNISAIENSLKPPYVMMHIKSSGGDIERVSYIFHDSSERYDRTMTSEVSNISLFLNSESLSQSGSLCEKVSQYLSFYSEADVLLMTVPPLTDTSGLLTDPTSSSSSMGVDAFIIGVCGYMGSMSMLMDEKVYGSIPFPFTLPFHTIGENVLNVNMFKYMSYPCTAVVTHSTYTPSRILFDHILKFCNEWGPLFDEGPPVDMNSSVMDTITGQCKLIVDDMSTYQNNMVFMRDELTNVYTEIKDSFDEINERTTKQLLSARDEIKEEMNKYFKEKERRLKREINDFITDKLELFRKDLEDLFVEEFSNASISSARLKSSKKKKKYSQSREKRRHRSHRHYKS